MDIPMDYSQTTDEYLQEILPEFDERAPEYLPMLEAIRDGHSLAIGHYLLDYISRKIRETRELKGLPADYDALHKEELEAAANERQAFSAPTVNLKWWLGRD